MAEAGFFLFWQSIINQQSTDLVCLVGELKFAAENRQQRVIIDLQFSQNGNSLRSPSQIIFDRLDEQFRLRAARWSYLGKSGKCCEVNQLVSAFEVINDKRSVITRRRADTPEHLQPKVNVLNSSIRECSLDVALKWQYCSCRVF